MFVSKTKLFLYFFICFSSLVVNPFISAYPHESCDMAPLNCSNAGSACDANTNCLYSHCIDGICKPNNFGSRCYSDDDCWGFQYGPSPICYGDICSPFVFPGDSCSTSPGGPLCEFGNEYCISGRCAPLNLGDVCTSTYQCGVDGYCKGNFQDPSHCFKRPTLGEVCDSFSPCAQSLACLGRCTFDRDLGQPCDRYNAITCKSGLYCSFLDQLCHENPPKELNYCNEEPSNCEYPCACKPGIPRPICPLDGSNQFWAMTRSVPLESCARNHNCSNRIASYDSIGIPVVPGSCLYDFCLQEFIDYISNYCQILAFYPPDECFSAPSFYFDGVFRCTSNQTFIPIQPSSSSSSSSSFSTILTHSSLLPSSTQISTSTQSSASTHTQLSTSAQFSTSTTSTQLSTSAPCVCPTPVALECTDHWFWYFMILLIIDIILLAAAASMWYSYKTRAPPPTQSFEPLSDRESVE